MTGPQSSFAWQRRMPHGCAATPCTLQCRRPCGALDSLPRLCLEAWFSRTLLFCSPGPPSGTTGSLAAIVNTCAVHLCVQALPALSGHTTRRGTTPSSRPASSRPASSRKPSPPCQAIRQGGGQLPPRGRPPRSDCMAVSCEKRSTFYTIVPSQNRCLTTVWQLCVKNHSTFYAIVPSQHRCLTTVWQLCVKKHSTFYAIVPSQHRCLRTV